MYHIANNIQYIAMCLLLGLFLLCNIHWDCSHISRIHGLLNRGRNKHKKGD